MHVDAQQLSGKLCSLLPEVWEAFPTEGSLWSCQNQTPGTLMMLW